MLIDNPHDTIAEATQQPDASEEPDADRSSTASCFGSPGHGPGPCRRGSSQLSLLFLARELGNKLLLGQPLRPPPVATYPAAAGLAVSASKNANVSRVGVLVPPPHPQKFVGPTLSQPSLMSPKSTSSRHPRSSLPASPAWSCSRGGLGCGDSWRVLDVLKVRELDQLTILDGLQGVPPCLVAAKRQVEPKGTT